MIPSIVASRVMKREQETVDKIYMTIKFKHAACDSLRRRNVCPGLPVMRLVFGDGRKLTAELLMLDPARWFLFPVHSHKRCAPGN